MPASIHPKRTLTHLFVTKYSPVEYFPASKISYLLFLKHTLSLCFESYCPSVPSAPTLLPAFTSTSTFWTHPNDWFLPDHLTPESLFPLLDFSAAHSVQYLFENQREFLSVLHFLSHRLWFILPMALNPFREDFDVSLWAPACLTTEGKTAMYTCCLIIYLFICARRNREERHKK